MRQKTIASSFTLSGKGLHTGLELTVTFRPAPENSGYRIRRVDLEGNPVIEALAENVHDTVRGTVLSCGDVRCSTVEHAFSALYIHGVDNVLVDVDGPEFPILDGSALPYVKEIARVGLTEQDAEKAWLEIKEPIEVSDEVTGSHLSICPADDLCVEVTIDFNSEMLPVQSASLTDRSAYDDEICRARTFVFVREVEQLLRLGLIKGGDLDNAIVVYEKEMSQERMDAICSMCSVERHDARDFGYIQHKALVWDNEPARHKLLDVIGDIALTGVPIRGRITAHKPGHAINNKLARKLRNLIHD